MNHFKKLYLLAIVLLLFFGTGTSAFAHTVNGHVECSTSGFVPYGAVVQAFEVDPLPGGAYNIDSSPLGTATVDYHGNFIITFVWPTPGSGFELGGPDLIFQMVQNVGGIVQTIYNEAASQTHWNIASGTSLTFQLTSGLAVCWNPAVDPSNPLADQPINNLFVFTKIGNCFTADIDCKGSLATSQGYYRPRKAPYGFSGMDSDQPFGSTLSLYGWFGSLVSNVTRYKLQFSSDAGATWTDIQTTLSNSWYDTSDPWSLNWHWVGEVMGPFNEGGVNNVYKIPYKERPTAIWADIGKLGNFNSTVTANGLNRIRLLGYKLSGGSLIPATSSDLLIDTNYGQIVLQIDNTPPTVQILNLKLNSVNTSVCDILNFGASDNIDISFRVNDQRGHLRNYSLQAMYGHNSTVTPTPTTPNKAVDDYNLNAGGSPAWSGNLNYTTRYNGTTYTSAMMPSCAYQFRLSASKRTTNGYGLIYTGIEDTWHVTIHRY